jgi:hypothetical protein
VKGGDKTIACKENLYIRPAAPEKLNFIAVSLLGTGKARPGIVANLSAGHWAVRRYDRMANQAITLSEEVSGRYTFDASASGAVLLHFKKSSNWRIA